MDWLPAEDAILKQIWDSSESLRRSIHRLPGRTWKAARGRATRLGLGGTAKVSKRRVPRACVVDKSIREQLGSGRPLTVRQLMKLTGHSRTQISRRLEVGHGPKFHVAGWTRSCARGQWMPRWTKGPGDDAEKPTPKANVEAAREYRRRLRIKQSNSPFAGLIEQVTA